jgi:hypothetical protein
MALCATRWKPSGSSRSAQPGDRTQPAFARKNRRITSAASGPWLVIIREHLAYCSRLRGTRLGPVMVQPETFARPLAGRLDYRSPPDLSRRPTAPNDHLPGPCAPPEARSRPDRHGRGLRVRCGAGDCWGGPSGCINRSCSRPREMGRLLCSANQDFEPARPAFVTTCATCARPRRISIIPLWLSKLDDGAGPGQRKTRPQRPISLRGNTPARMGSKFA